MKDGTARLLKTRCVYCIYKYCPTTWHFCSKKVAKLMERIYERFAMNDPSRSYEELLTLTKCDTIFYGS